MNYNRAIIAGRVTRKPELRATKEGMTVANFGVAINEKYKTKTGEQKENTDFIDVTVFGKLADVCADFLSKGQQVIIEGKIKVRKWEKDGETRSSTYVQAGIVQFGAKPGKRDAKEVGDDTSLETIQTEAPDAKQTAKVATSDAIEYPEETIDADSIPF